MSDIARAKAFYESLGWEVGFTDGDVVFLQAGGLVFALWGRAKLAEDSGMSDDGGWGGVTLAYCVASEQEVEALLAQAREAGAGIPREGAPTPWGGYSGVFVDPDGHPWEVARNPGWALHEDGTVSLTD